MEPVRLSRLRWRLTGAWQWPSFFVLTAVNAIVIHELPPVGDKSAGWIPALLLGAFANLVAVAVVAPLGGALLRRYRRDLPTIVARDRAGTTALIAVTLGFGAVGLSHRPVRQAGAAEFAAVARAVRMYVATQAEPRYRPHIHDATVVRLGDLYRTCVPGGPDGRELCLFVDGSQRPPGIRVDPNPVSNAIFVRGFIR